MTTAMAGRRTLSARARVMTFAAIACAVALIAPVLGWAHAVVYPKNSAAGARERYTIRVPNERAVPTTRVEITFPASIRVSGFLDVPGWKLEVVRDSAKVIRGAVWTGSLGVERFVDFTFAASNPKEPGEITWPVLQTYADGELASWTGPKGSDRPASSTIITAPPPPADSMMALPGGGGPSPWLTYAALGLSVISLGLSMRRRDAAPTR
jgi:uncharacterized protein YcnI